MCDLSGHVSGVRKLVRDLYASQTEDVPFHGWPHIRFVAEKAMDFAAELGADQAAASIAGYVHDVNYLVARRGDARDGRDLRQKILYDAGLPAADAEAIEQIVVSAETRHRDGGISPEAKALSDADTLFKALPITPVKLAPLYMRETGRSLRELAGKIVEEQLPLQDQGIYFYSRSASQKYAEWADVNLRLWTAILDAMQDPAISALVDEVDQHANGRISR